MLRSTFALIQGNAIETKREEGLREALAALSWFERAIYGGAVERAFHKGFTAGAIAGLDSSDEADDYAAKMIQARKDRT